MKKCVIVGPMETCGESKKKIFKNLKQCIKYLIERNIREFWVFENDEFGEYAIKICEIFEKNYYNVKVVNNKCEFDNTKCLIIDKCDIAVFYINSYVYSYKNLSFYKYAKEKEKEIIDLFRIKYVNKDVLRIK